MMRRMSSPPAHPRALALTLMTLVLVALSTAPPALARPGAVDRSFGDEGFVSTQLGWASRAFSIALQPDGKIVAGGWVWASENSSVLWGLARYLRDGGLDPTFGRRGVVLTDVGTAEGIRHVLLQRDRRIVAVGGDFALRRYLPNGSLDPGFARGGIPRSTATAAALQPDGKIVVVGAGRSRPAGTDLVVARYRTDGTPDTTFANGGVFLLPVPGVINVAEDVALAPDGSIVVAGWTSDAILPAAGITVWRLTPDGELDLEVNPVRTLARQLANRDRFWFVSSIVVRPDGRILVGGNESDLLFPFTGEMSKGLLVQLLPTGRLDAEFGEGGVAFPFAAHRVADDIKDLALQPNGDVVTVGTRYVPEWRGLVARVDPDGTLDGRFGSGGTIVTPRAWASWWAGAVARDGKVVVGGLYSPPGDHPFRFALARYRSA
jgi:uncharacterized delta-60 repeat protein